MKDFLNESEYLVHLVRCAIHDEQPREMPKHLSFSLVYGIGVKHDVANIAFYSVKKLKRKPEEKLYQKWEMRCNMALTRDVNQSFAREEILDAFQAAGIRILEVQGTKIKQFYPQPEYRTMSDLDFIIDRENLPRAYQILEGLGYECEDIEGVEVDAFRPPNINIEIHSEYFSKHNDYHDLMRPPFASVDETGEYDFNDFYIYNILHVAKHYFLKGCGLRRILDVYYLNRHYTPLLNWEYVNSYFEKADVQDFFRKVSALAQYWFGDGECTEDVNRMIQYIMGSGVHGNSRHSLENHLRDQYGEGIRLFRLKYFCKRLFVSKEVLYIRYPRAKKWKILLPYYWIHRLFTAVGDKNRRRIKEEVEVVSEGQWKQEQY